MHLTVVHPFKDYQRGDKITDEAEISDVLKGENAKHVVKTADPQD